MKTAILSANALGATSSVVRTLTASRPGWFPAGWLLATLMLGGLGCGGTSVTPAADGGAAGGGTGGSAGGGGAGGGGSDAGPTPTCGGLAGRACGPAQYCEYPAAASCGAGDQTGSCVNKPSACDEIYAPVCGCDGKTYSSDCSAHRERVTVASIGGCDTAGGCMVDGVSYPDGASIPSTDGCNTCRCTGGELACTARACTMTACGARAGNTCKGSEYCAYTTGQLCGAADASSYCKARPTACTKELVYVCGCNGMTYTNACEAARAGTGVLSNGACAP